MTATDSTAEKKAKRSAYYKTWRAANKEKLKADGAAYYIANKERMNSAGAEHYRAHAEEYKERAAKWAKQNLKRRYEVTSKWRKEHPELYVEAARRGWIKHRPKRLAVLKEYRAKNVQKMRALNAAWKEKNPEAQAHHCGLRRTRKMKATPAWANIDAIRMIYKRASELSKETGVAHHVDHEIPLKHSLVCGLHCEFNLRVIPARENCEKKNKFSV